MNTATLTQDKVSNLSVTTPVQINGVALALAIFVPVLLLGALAATELKTVMQLDQMRLTAATVGAFSSFSAIPSLYLAVKRNSVKAVLTVAGVVAFFLGFLMPLSV